MLRALPGDPRLCCSIRSEGNVETREEPRSPVMRARLCSLWSAAFSGTSGGRARLPNVVRPCCREAAALRGAGPPVRNGSQREKSARGARKWLYGQSLALSHVAAAAARFVRGAAALQQRAKQRLRLASLARCR